MKIPSKEYRDLCDAISNYMKASKFNVVPDDVESITISVNMIRDREDRMSFSWPMFGLHRSSYKEENIKEGL